MSANIIAKSEIQINAPASTVWEALTTPEIISRYMLNTQVASEWKIGSEIRWRGQYRGTEYEDKGSILQMLPDKLFQHTYHSSLSNLDDSPENYLNVTYELNEEDGKTILTVTNSNLPDEEAKTQVTKSWRGLLNKLKEVVEGKLEKTSV